MRSTLRIMVPFLLALLLIVRIPSDAMAEGSGPLYTVRQRFGVNIAPSFGGVPTFPGSISDFRDADQLGFGWYSDWKTRRSPECPNGIEFAQLVKTRHWPPNWASLRRAIRDNPGSLWIIGNEPETRGQGQHTPSEYAERYHEAYYFIKSVDPSAEVAIGGVVMPSPLRLKWLELCMTYYESAYDEPMPIDVWNIHVQILQERRGDWGCGIPQGLDEDEGRLYEIVDNCNAEMFEQLIVEFRTWLYEQGDHDKPVIVSEYGTLMPSSYLPHGDQSVLDFMQDTFDYLLEARDPVLGYSADEGRLVQRWLWFSLNFPFYDNTPGGFNGALYDWQDPDQLTVFGELYRDYVKRLAPEQAVIPVSRDTYVDMSRPRRSYGHKGRIKIKADADEHLMFGFLYFDLSQIPQGAEILDAELTMQVVARSNAQPIHLYIGPASTEWGNSTTYRDMQRLELERGQPSIGVAISRVDERIECEVTEIVRAWHEGQLANHGFMIDTIDAGTTGRVTYDLASSEWKEGRQQKPELCISYITH